MCTHNPVYVKRCWDWAEDVSHAVFLLLVLPWCPVLYPEITPGYQPFQDDICSIHRGSSRRNQGKVRASAIAQAGGNTRDPCHRRMQGDNTYWFCEKSLTGTSQTWGKNLKFQYCWAHRLSRNLDPAQPVWLCGTHFMWNMLQTVPFRTIIAFLRTIMYYVWCIIYSGGYRFIKESWANCQVIVWTVVTSNKKGYNLHSYSVFKLMSYPLRNPALGFFSFCAFSNSRILLGFLICLSDMWYPKHLLLNC